MKRNMKKAVGKTVKTNKSLRGHGLNTKRIREPPPKNRRTFLLIPQKTHQRIKTQPLKEKLQQEQAQSQKKQKKDPDKEDFAVKAFQMLMHNHKQTLEALMGNNKGAITEDEKLDQEDQRIKEVEVGKLEEVNENASIACGDWIHRIRPVICNLSKRAKKYWTLVEEIVNERCKRAFDAKPSGKAEQRVQRS